MEKLKINGSYEINGMVQSCEYIDSNSLIVDAINENIDLKKDCMNRIANSRNDEDKRNIVKEFEEKTKKNVDFLEHFIKFLDIFDSDSKVKLDVFNERKQSPIFSKLDDLANESKKLCEAGENEYIQEKENNKKAINNELFKIIFTINMLKKYVNEFNKDLEDPYSIFINFETQYNLGQQTSGQQTSGQQTPGQQTSGQQTPGQQTPGQQTPGQQTSGQQTSGQQTPGQQTPGQQTPGQQTPGQQTPGQQTPGQQTPGQQTPGQQTPGQQTPGQQTPGQQTPGQQVPNVSDDFKLPDGIVRNVNAKLIKKLGTAVAIGLTMAGVAALGVALYAGMTIPVIIAGGVYYAPSILVGTIIGGVLGVYPAIKIIGKGFKLRKNFVAKQTQGNIANRIANNRINKYVIKSTSDIANLVDKELRISKLNDQDSIDRLEVAKIKCQLRIKKLRENIIDIQTKYPNEVNTKYRLDLIAKEESIKELESLIEQIDKRIEFIDDPEQQIQNGPHR